MYISVARLNGYNEFTRNCMRQVLYASTNSFLFIRTYTTLNVSNNIMYTVVKQRNSYNKNGKHICLFQFASLHPVENIFIKMPHFTVLMRNNEVMISKSLPGQEHHLKTAHGLVVNQILLKY